MTVYLSNFHFLLLQFREGFFHLFFFFLWFNFLLFLQGLMLIQDFFRIKLRFHYSYSFHISRCPPIYYTQTSSPTQLHLTPLPAPSVTVAARRWSDTAVTAGHPLPRVVTRSQLWASVMKHNVRVANEAGYKASCSPHLTEGENTIREMEQKRVSAEK